MFALSMAHQLRAPALTKPHAPRRSARSASSERHYPQQDDCRRRENRENGNPARQAKARQTPPKRDHDQQSADEKPKKSACHRAPRCLPRPAPKIVGAVGSVKFENVKANRPSFCKISTCYPQRTGARGINAKNRRFKKNAATKSPATKPDQTPTPPQPATKPSQYPTGRPSPI